MSDLLDPDSCDACESSARVHFRSDIGGLVLCDSCIDWLKYVSPLCAERSAARP